jgi:hypothetical protein
MNWLAETRSAPATGQVVALGNYGKTLMVLEFWKNGLGLYRGDASSSA